jgi:hypothetical protein
MRRPPGFVSFCTGRHKTKGIRRHGKAPKSVTKVFRDIIYRVRFLIFEEIIVFAFGLTAKLSLKVQEDIFDPLPGVPPCPPDFI